MTTQQPVGAGRPRRSPTRRSIRGMVALGVSALIATAGLAVTATMGPHAQAATAPLRIMPLGDSITGGPGCWRAVLWTRLQNTGYTNIDFVGTLPGGGCNVASWDGDNEGHGGYLATGIADQNLLPGWLSATNPDIVLMHLGTNDNWNNIATTTILTAYSKLVDQMRANNPNVKIIVAQIIPMAPSGCTYCPSGVVALNNAIPAWAASKTTAQSPIVVVDQWTGFDPVADTIGDGVHPNDAGFQKMSDRWYPALVQFLNGATGTTPPTTATSPTRTSASPTRTSASPSPTRTSASPSPTGTGGGCTATYSIAGSWPGGFQGKVTVTNTGTRPTTGWSVTWTFANGQVISQLWGGTSTQTGASVSVTNLSWNGGLAAGGSTDFGFIASATSTNQVPTNAACRSS